MLNILSIGNSFSMDATRYLHQIARADKVDLTTANLYIGGCPLHTHFKNMTLDRADYELGINGCATKFRTSIKDALVSTEWDVVTLQQFSAQSANYETYQPYLNELVSCVKKYAPKAKIVIHRTWAYEEGSTGMAKLGYASHADMFEDIKKAYDKAAKEINAAYIIDSGAVMKALLENGIEKIHRDPVHATLGTARYALGLLWYATITGNDITNNTFNDFDVPVPDEEIAIVKKCVNEVLKRN